MILFSDNDKQQHQPQKENVKRTVACATLSCLVKKIGRDEKKKQLVKARCLEVE